MRADAKFCSAKCNSKAHLMTRIHRQRERQKGLWKSELLTLAEIAERTSERCGICGGRIDMAKKWPDALAPSIDHVKPLSLGGSNGLDNVQVAHFRCNFRKRDQFKI
jgi:5-methylcytosine-specific restriction endonuclease McrA